MRGDQRLYEILDLLEIKYEYYEHAAAFTIEVAKKAWKDIPSTHCKNLFFRNHKGNKHYLVILEHDHILAVKDLEAKLKQGKISFASPKRLHKYLGLTGGSVSPFGLINDESNHVHVFLDHNLKRSKKISFHPNINTASLVISFHDFEKYLKWTNNTFEYIMLYKEN
jgi:Ala-tRNA(Pro) deacylase